MSLYYEDSKNALKLLIDHDNWSLYYDIETLKLILITY